MNLTINQKRMFSIIKFLFIFNLVAIPLQLIIFFNVSLYPLAFMERAQASAILNLFGVRHYLHDVPYANGSLPAININNQVLAIGEPCTAIRSLLAFIGLVVASPKSSDSKKKALLFLPIIYFVNVIRIATLGFVSLSFPSFFDLVHIFFWREGLIFLILGLWMYWFNTKS